MGFVANFIRFPAVKKMKIGYDLTFVLYCGHSTQYCHLI